MILYELVGRSEDHPAYRALETSNGERHYSFLHSAVSAALAVDRPFMSQTVIKAMNYHAIACLHTNAGEYRPCPVRVGDHAPPEHYRVNALMDDFVNVVNRRWGESDMVLLATYVLWRLNHIHPFINGNGRTARAACYFVLCVKAGGWLSGDVILPERLRSNRYEYVEALRKADEAEDAGEPDLTELCALVSRMLAEQLSMGR